MQQARYYREQAELSRRLAARTTDKPMSKELNKIARDFDDIAVDLEQGAIEFRHPELMPQLTHPE
jgi:hypothetical protein